MDRGLALSTIDHTGALWVGTDGGGLNIYDVTAGGFRSFRHDPNEPTSLSTDRVYSVYEDRSRVLWVGTYGGGLNRLDPEKGTFTRIPFGSDDHSISSPRVTCIA